MIVTLTPMTGWHLPGGYSAAKIIIYYHTMNPYASKKENKRLKEIDIYFPKVITE